MRKKVVTVVLAIFSFITLTHAQQAAAPPASAEAASETAGRLPVKRVVLYKNGVGYFEHSTHVRGTQDLNIDFTSAQLNDALKSLTVVDLGDGRITGVRFNSVAPLSERLKTLRLPLGEEASRNDLLGALRGTRVEVRSGATGAAGKVLGFEVMKKFGDKPELVEEVTVLTLVTDAGEVRSFDLGPGASVRIADSELAEEVNRYLNLIGSAKAVDLRRLTISAAGTGEREIFVSYISEVPVWKSTYRILLDQKHGDKPLVQGWAVVDNTIGEDWKDVQLSLVAGAPQSFVQNISQPMYVRRPEVPLPESAMLTPQTHESAMNAPAPPPPPPPGEGGGIAPGRAGLEGTVKDQSGAGVGGAQGTLRNEATGESQTVTSDPQGYYRFNNVAPGNSALFVNASGFQRFALTNIYIGVGRLNEIHPSLSVESVAQAVEVRAAAPQLQTETSEVSESAERQGSEAEAKAVGDFFEYDLKEKVTIGKNQSALVPILRARIDTEKVTLWNEDSNEPLRALWLSNTSGVEFDAGSLNILEEGTFSGEGMLAVLRPGEKRLISYAADPAVRIKVEGRPTEKPFSRIQIIKGTMIMTKEERERKTYTISNSDAAPRDVIIEHPVRPEWKLAEGAKPEETTASLQRFRVKVEPKAGAQLVVEEYHPLATRVELSNVSDEEITLLSEQKRMTPELKQALKRVLDQKGVIDALDKQITTRQQEVNAIATDQGRIRENMKALKGSVEEKALLQRYTHQLDVQEDRLAGTAQPDCRLHGEAPAGRRPTRQDPCRD
ncbi:MAG: carboxypeptidase regulatory-like domain-containing protein [Terriglobia bacterium]|jgi:hypothetical protein